MKIDLISLYSPEYQLHRGYDKAGFQCAGPGLRQRRTFSDIKKRTGITRSQGIEIDEKAIYECVAKGVSVFHGDIDSGLSEYGDKSFDYVILNQTFQQVKETGYRS